MRVEVIRRRAEGALIVPRVAVQKRAGKAEIELSGGKVQPIEIDWCTELSCVLRAGGRGEIREGTSLIARAPSERGAS